MTVSYKNRYGDIYTFTKYEDGNILWEGPFNHLRMGFPNDYTKAYNAYISENENITLETFKEKVHFYDEEKQMYPLIMYAKLVESLKDKINMIDPSGGPYINVGMDMGYIHENFKDMIVEDIIDVNGGYKLIIKK
jgi:hypothetical protein